jgi:hypothetical protein
MCSMLHIARGKHGWRQVAQRTMGSVVVIVLAPVGQHTAHMAEAGKPVLAC